MIEIKVLKIKEIKPYKNNPRNNEEAVEPVMNSIKEFGFKVPVIVDKNNIVVAGHTRLKAAEKLGLEEVPCIIADDLTEEQINAFRLADNKTGEIATWDFDLLNIELNNILNVDMSSFGFEPMKEIDLDISDDDFISDTEITKSKTKKIVCPHCGMEFEV